MSQMEHSLPYQNNLILNKNLDNYNSLTYQIDTFIKQSKHSIIAIDGNCVAGKTTLAALLKEIYNCNVIHMDYFFLRPEQRTDDRLAEVGGNIDYERFLNEVLVPLQKKCSFSYCPYNCKNQSFDEPIVIEQKLINIVEGVYSLHPKLSNAYDYKVFLSVDPEQQIKRLENRNGGDKVKRFKDEWVPMEEKYFSAFKIVESCNLHINT